MCVIIHLAAGATINKQQLFNAVHNNWHGYGVLLRDDDRLWLNKKFDKDGTNPEDVWKLIEDNKDIERYVHLRFSTRGATDEGNTQPFEVYNSASRQVFFMHNGTLNSFGNHNTGASDTKEFCETVLSPALLRWDGEYGKADYNDPMFYKLVVDKQWVSHSKGLFISNDLDPLRIGAGWSEYKHPNHTSSGTVWVSNTEYFEKAIRGPIFQLQEDARKAREEEERKAKVDNAPFHIVHHGTTGETSGTVTGTDGVKQWKASNACKDPAVLKAFTDIASTWDFEDSKLVAHLRFITFDEWVTIMQDHGEYAGAALMETFADHIATITMKLKLTERKQKNAEKRIQEMTNAQQRAA